MKKLIVVLALSLAFVHTVYAATLVDLNTASRTHLESVPGIGPGKARAIVEYRTQYGPFKSVEELEKVSGFGKKTIEKIRARLTVSQPVKRINPDTPAVDSNGTWKGVIR